MGYIVLDSIIFVYILLDDSNDLLPLDESIDYIVHRMAAAASLVRTYTDGIYGEREALMLRRVRITVCAVASTVRAFRLCVVKADVTLVPPLRFTIIAAARW